MLLKSDLTAVTFHCNVCLSDNYTPVNAFHRELAPCRTCGSNPRFRGIVRALSVELFGAEHALPDFPSSNFRGIGMSDAPCYSDALTKRLDYTNTYYHCEPKLDIMDMKSVSRWRDLDFVISSDVFEHVPVPPQRAFDNAYALLKPGGFLLLTVPYIDTDDTIEHFPDLHSYDVMPFEGSYVLVNRRQDGGLWVRDKLTFHGGPGSTLEMRIFGRGALLRHLKEAGFGNIVEYSEPALSIGYFWPACVELPGTTARSLGYVITARRQR
jgi:SAM-dependent methyltransferase